MLDAFQLPFVQRGLLELVVFSLAAGLLGTWIVLRGLAFYSHAVATASFPGLVLAGGLGFAAPLGAFAVGGLFALSVGRLAAARRTGYETATALVLTGALATGTILASDVFHSGSDVDSLLFGSLLTLGTGDVVLAGVASLLALVATAVMGQRWLALGFDPAGARALGVRSNAPDVLLLALVAVTAVAALSALGALLATALLVVPAATARLWTQRVASLQAWSVAVAVLDGVAGLWLSVQIDVPPGAAIAIVAGGLFVLAAAGRELRRSPRKALAAGAAALALLGLGGCRSVGGSNGKPVAVATTTQLGDFAREVGGDAVDVHQLLQPNTDPHEYEPRPSDVVATADAKVVFTNGDKLDRWMGKVVSQSGGHPKAVDLSGTNVLRLPGESSGPEASRYDPHWWHDPRNAEAAVAGIRDALAAAEPSKRALFDRNAAAYIGRLRALDAHIRGCFATVPRAERKLVTSHDAFGYFARRYGVTVVGAIIPSQTTQAQPSARDVARLSDQVRREHVRAIFLESSVSPKLAEAVAREDHVIGNLTLYGDTLGGRGSSGATYVDMERHNADAMLRGFTGGARGCS
jgi:ABC-type Zn uptake system ZnuABC Zn-binding protein ZnuA/ABC-type Mn2+/Zn2+ transport system permease subunit